MTKLITRRLCPIWVKFATALAPAPPRESAPRLARDLTFTELRRRSPRPSTLRAVLGEEVRCGRVRRRGNRYELVLEKFEDGVLAALERFEVSSSGS